MLKILEKFVNLCNVVLKTVTLLIRDAFIQETNDANSSDDSVSAEKMVLPVHSLQTIHAGYCIKQGGRVSSYVITGISSSF